MYYVTRDPNGMYIVANTKNVKLCTSTYSIISVCVMYMYMYIHMYKVVLLLMILLHMYGTCTFTAELID